MNPIRSFSTTIALALLLFCEFSCSLHSQTVLWEEQFEEASLNPAIWSIVVDSSSDGWRLGEATTLSSAFFRIPSNGKFIASNDDACGQECRKNPDRLRRNAFALPNQATELSLRYFFQSHQQGNALERAQIVISGQEKKQSYPLTTTGNGWLTKVVPLTDFQGQSVTIDFEYDDGGGWNLGLALDALVIQTIPALDAQISELRINRTPTVLSEAKIQYTITNTGTDTIDALRAFWRCENCPDSATKIDHWIAAKLAPQSSKVFFHAIPFIGQLPEAYHLSFGIDSLNHSTQSNLLNPQWRTVVTVVQYPENRQHLLTFSTSANCGLCPDFWEELPALNRKFPQLQPLAIHISDSLSQVQNVELTTNLGLQPLPTARLNLDRSWNRQMSIPELIDSLEKSSPLSTARLLLSQLNRKTIDTLSYSANILVRALSQLPTRHSLHLQVYIREDSIQRLGPGFDQLNIDGSFLQKFRHRWVSRYSQTNDGFGVPLSEAPVVLDSGYAINLNFQLPPDANVNRCVILPVLFQYDSTANRWSLVQVNAFPIATNLRKPVVRLSRYGTLGCTQHSKGAWLEASTNVAIENPQFTWFRDGDSLAFIGPRIPISVDSLRSYKVRLSGAYNGRQIELTDSLIIGPLVVADFSSSGRRFPVDSTFAVVEVPVRFEPLVFPPGEYRYFWEFGDSLTDSVANPVHIYRQRGTFDVSLTVRDTCNQVAQYTKKNWIEIGSISVSRPKTQPILAKQFSFFPNPSTDRVHLRWNQPNAGFSISSLPPTEALDLDQISCWNVKGQQVNLPVLSTHNSDAIAIFDVSHLASGLYIIVLPFAGQVISYKLLIER